MFDIFATILSAGVVISVVTLVVHEPMLLAAGISTILGLMFLLLPMFVAMVPALGYLLIFIGLVGLAYGLASTRSWLNTIQARRDAAMARRRALYAGQGQPKDDSERRRGREAAGVAALRRDEEADSADDGAPVYTEPARGEGRGLGDGTSALARIGRGLGRERERERRPEPEEEVRPQGKPWRNPFDTEPEARVEAEPEPEREPVPAAASASLLPPPLPPPLRPLAVAPEPADAVRPPRPLSPGAARIHRVKSESRRPAPAPRRRPVEAAPPPAAVPLPTVAPAPEAVERDLREQERRKARHDRDLLELDLIDAAPEPEEARAERPAKGKANGKDGKTFVARLARRP